MRLEYALRLCILRDFYKFSNSSTIRLSNRVCRFEDDKHTPITGKLPSLDLYLLPNILKLLKRKLSPAG